MAAPAGLLRHGNWHAAGAALCGPEMQSVLSLIVLHPTWSVSVGFVRLLLSSRVSGSPSWGSSLPTRLAQELCFLLSHISHFWGSISVLLFFLFLFMVWFEFLVHPCICVNHKFKNNFL